MFFIFLTHNLLLSLYCCYLLVQLPETTQQAKVTVGANSKSCGAVACDFVGNIADVAQRARSGDEIMVYGVVEIPCELHTGVDHYVSLEKPLKIKGAIPGSGIRLVSTDTACDKTSLFTISSSGVKIEDMTIELTGRESREFIDIKIDMTHVHEGGEFRSDELSSTAILSRYQQKTQPNTAVSAAAASGNYSENIEISRMTFDKNFPSTSIYVGSGKHFDMKIQENDFSCSQRRSAVFFEENAKMNGIRIWHNAFVNAGIVMMSPAAGRKTDVIDATYNYWYPQPLSQPNYRTEPSHFIQGAQVSTIPYCHDRLCKVAGPIFDKTDPSVGFTTISDYKVAYSAKKTPSQKVGITPVVTFVSLFYALESMTILDFPINITSSNFTRLIVESSLVNSAAFSVVANMASFSNINVSIPADGGAGFVWYRPERALSSVDLEAIPQTTLSSDAQKLLKRGSPLRSTYATESVATLEHVNIEGGAFGVLVFSDGSANSLLIDSCQFTNVNMAIFSRWPNLRVQNSIIQDCTRGLLVDVTKGTSVGGLLGVESPSLMLSNNTMISSPASIIDSGHCGGLENADGVSSTVVVENNFFYDSPFSMASLQPEESKLKIYSNMFSRMYLEAKHRFPRVFTTALPVRNARDEPSLAQACLVIHSGVRGVLSKLNSYHNCHVFISARGYRSQEDIVSDESIVFVSDPLTTPFGQCFDTDSDGTFSTLSVVLPMRPVEDANVFENMRVGDPSLSLSAGSPGHVSLYRISDDNIVYLIGAQVFSDDPMRYFNARLEETGCGEVVYPNLLVYDLHDQTEIRGRYQSLSTFNLGDYLTESQSVSSCGFEDRVPLKFSRETCECLPLGSNEIYQEGPEIPYIFVKPLVVATLPPGQISDKSHTKTSPEIGSTDKKAVDNSSTDTTSSATVINKASKPLASLIANKISNNALPVSESKPANREKLATDEHHSLLTRKSKRTASKVVDRKRHADHDDFDDDDDDGDYHHGGGVVLWVFFGIGGLIFVIVLIVLISWNSGSSSSQSVTSKSRHTKR